MLNPRENGPRISATYVANPHDVGIGVFAYDDEDAQKCCKCKAHIENYGQLHMLPVACMGLGRCDMGSRGAYVHLEHISTTNMRKRQEAIRFLRSVLCAPPEDIIIKALETTNNGAK